MSIKTKRNSNNPNNNSGLISEVKKLFNINLVSLTIIFFEVINRSKKIIHFLSKNIKINTVHQTINLKWFV